MSAILGAAVDTPMTNAQLDQLSINCIRTLSIDAVQQAKSGHPGTPMALAPLVYTLWNRVMAGPQSSTPGLNGCLMRDRIVRCGSAKLEFHKRTFGSAIAMSALPTKADICSAISNVRFVPIADISRFTRSPRPRAR